MKYGVDYCIGDWRNTIALEACLYEGAEEYRQNNPGTVVLPFKETACKELLGYAHRIQEGCMILADMKTKGVIVFELDEFDKLGGLYLHPVVGSVYRAYKEFSHDDFYFRFELVNPQNCNFDYFNIPIGICKRVSWDYDGTTLSYFGLPSYYWNYVAEQGKLHDSYMYNINGV